MSALNLTLAISVLEALRRRLWIRCRTIIDNTDGADFDRMWDDVRGKGGHLDPDSPDFDAGIIASRILIAHHDSVRPQGEAFTQKDMYDKTIVATTFLRVAVIDDLLRVLRVLAGDGLSSRYDGMPNIDEPSETFVDLAGDGPNSGIDLQGVLAALNLGNKPKD